jgi:hypothetical protein
VTLDKSIFGKPLSLSSLPSTTNAYTFHRSLSSFLGSSSLFIKHHDSYSPLSVFFSLIAMILDPSGTTTFPDFDNPIDAYTLDDAYDEVS